MSQYIVSRKRIIEMLTKEFSPGLAGIVAAETRISDVDGEAGRLVIAGFPVEELAPKAAYEEMAYLIWHDRLPDGDELAAMTQSLVENRTLPEITIEVLKAAAEQRAAPMDALRMAAATLSLDTIDAEPTDEACAIAAKFPTIIASYWRLKDGKEPVAPRGDLGQAANYLYMLRGEEPSAAEARALETYLNTVSDHAMNASTFTGRVIIATGSDLVSAVTGAVGALKGPLHGGAPGPALDMVFDIGKPERAEEYLRELLRRGERIMGFGHRVYKVRDPRADVLAGAASILYAEGAADHQVYELAMHVEETALRLLEEYKPGRRLQTNVEFYTALILHGLQLDTELFTPTFAIGRVLGWIGHCFEQQRTGRLIRPQSQYIGETNRKYVPINER